jgi:hypothetical protein
LIGCRSTGSTSGYPIGPCDGFQVHPTEAGVKFIDKVVVALAEGRAIAQPIYDIAASERQGALHLLCSNFFARTCPRDERSEHQAARRGKLRAATAAHR